MLNATHATQGLEPVMVGAWLHRPSDKATHYCTLTKTYYAVCDWCSSSMLFVWCDHAVEWVEVEPSKVGAILEKAHAFDASHKSKTEL